MGDHYGRHEIEAERTKREPTQQEIAAKEQAKLFAWVAKLPPMVVTPQEFERLSEYSASHPTGTTPGKLWKSELNSYWHAYIKAGGKTRWIIRQYDPEAKPYDPEDKSTHGDIKILQFRPVVRVKATQVICHDRWDQLAFLIDQLYVLSGCQPYEHSVSEARAECQRRGFDVPTTRSLYKNA